MCAHLPQRQCGLWKVISRIFFCTFLRILEHYCPATNWTYLKILNLFRSKSRPDWWCLLLQSKGWLPWGAILWWDEAAWSKSKAFDVKIGDDSVSGSRVVAWMTWLSSDSLISPPAWDANSAKDLARGRTRTSCFLFLNPGSWYVLDFPWDCWSFFNKISAAVAFLTVFL